MPDSYFSSRSAPLQHLRDLARREQEEQAKQRLREPIEEGTNSGAGRALTPRRAVQLKKLALGGP